MVLSSVTIRETKQMKKICVFTLMLFMLLCGCASETQYEVNSSESEISGESLDDSSEDTDDRSNTESTSESTVSSSAENTICVYVCGQVANPGVYDLKDGSRVYEAIEAAGGIVGEVDTTRINMAQKLSDGQQITVTEEGAEGTAASQGTGSGSTKVNINTASADELMTLSGIGEARAEAIIDYRTNYGRFESAEELLNISGIGEKMLAKIIDNVEV